MEKKKEKIQVVWSIIIGLLLLGYLGIFAYLNLVKYNQHVDSDIAAEALLAREIWEEKTLTPDHWISSTERRILSMPAFAALIYGMTGSMQVSVGIACVLIGGLFFWTLYWFLKRSGISTLSALAGLLIICAVPINGIRNGEQIVPFVTLLLYLFAEYYVFHSILLFFSIRFYLHLKEKGEKKQKCNKMDWFVGFFLFGFTTLLSLGGQRCLQMVVLPLVIYETICLFKETQGFTVRIKKERIPSLCYTATTLVASMISVFYDREAGYLMYLQEPTEIMKRLFITVPAAMLEGFGIAGNAKLGTFASLMQLLVWAFLMLVCFSVGHVLNRKKHVPGKQRESMMLLLLSVGITVGIICITTTEAAHNYLMVSWFAAILAVTIVLDYYLAKKSFFAGLILVALCGFALLNVKYTWAEAVSTTDNLKEYQEVADYLVQEEISYGYGEFWDASRISLLTDGKVTMGHSYTMSDLKMYWWLTSKEWYPPYLETDMRTAYVVKLQGKEAFEAQFTNPGQVKLVFENNGFAVYVGEQNLVVQ